MDICGNTIAVLLKFPGFLRYINWIFGLGLFVFFWFLIHLFIPFRTNYVATSLIIFISLFLPLYIKNRGLLTLMEEVLKFPYPLIFLLLIAPKLFFLISMPPYVTDELAYHYYSPMDMTVSTKWDFSNHIGLYYMLPRTLETAYGLMFTLANTYAIARLLHFVIFISSISAISVFLKEKINIFIALAYSFFAIFLFAVPLVDSTRGYIDVAPAILSNLLLITIFGWLMTKEKGYLYSAFALIGLVTGMKYTILGFVAAVIIFSLVFFIFRNISEVKKHTDLQILKNLIRSNLLSIFIVPVLVIIMGGYWYIKNYIVTANPIYPFVFPCKDNISCSSKNEFFGEWGIKFKIENLPKIMQFAQESLK